MVDAAWPKADAAMLVSDSVVLPIQINGKRRAEIEVPKDMSKEEIEAIVLADETVRRFMEGAAPKKLIVVPGRIVNVAAQARILLSGALARWPPAALPPGLRPGVL